MRFSVDTSVFGRVPGFIVGIVVARNIDTGRGAERAADMLAQSVATAIPTLSGKPKEDPRITPYREAFRSFGINPNTFMCSIEALATRIAKTGILPSIHGIVDAGNAVSVRAFLPIGAHDLGPLGDEIEIRPARAGDSFVPFGQTEAESVDAGEIVYVSGTQVRTRRWMWRQSELGKIGDGTRDVFFPIDGFMGINDGALLLARDGLAELLRTEFGASVTTGFVDREHPVFVCD